MKISCIMASHDKPDYVCSAIDAILAQTHTDWELIIMDSGVLSHKDYYSRWKDERVKDYSTGETDETRATKAMAPWSFNEAFRRDLVSGDLVCYCGDDDFLYPNAFEVFNQFFTRNPEWNAVYASIDLAFYYHGRDPHVYDQRRAFEIGGKDAHRMDCRVDMLQICHRKSVFVEWPEERFTESHADGVFMERLGQENYFYPIPIKIGQNRRTPVSRYYPLI